MERVIPLLSNIQRTKHLVWAKRIRSNWGLGAGKYHKSHISKVIGICTVAYAFINNVENGGVALKLDLSRCQSKKVAGRIQKASRRDDDGKLVYDGEVIRRKGDLYLVDCNVTGSSCGTADDPKFALLNYFEDLVFAAVKDLVKVGGQFEGYLPII
mmetsp:Transcript_8170/g.7707  ORF Transcript_8170/g.7707 Transcript_8170/m.7707 type:complete len:156 (-) Transcript_8170:331-798(-)